MLRSAAKISPIAALFRIAACKIPVFGLLKIGGKVYLLVTKDTANKTLMLAEDRKSSLTALFTLTATKAMGFWMFQSLGIVALTIIMSLPKGEIILKASRTFVSGKEAFDVV